MNEFSEKKILRILINVICFSLSLINLFDELVDVDVDDTFKTFAADVFFRSTILFREMLPVVFRRRDKYELRSVVALPEKALGGERKEFSFTSEGTCLV